MGRMVEESDGESMDERTRRRLMRKYRANGIDKPDLCFSTPKKSTKCNAQVEKMYDKDYETYLSRLIQKKGDLNGHCSGQRTDVMSGVVEDSGDRKGQCGVDDGEGNMNNRSVSNGDGNNRVGSLNEAVVDHDGMDPQYKMFWENLRVEGNSIVLEIVQEDGSVKQIRYPQGDGLPDDLDSEKTKLKIRETTEKLEDAPVKKSSMKKKNVRSRKRTCSEVLITLQSVGTSLLKENTETRKNSRTVIKKRNLEDCPEKSNGLEKKSSMLKKNLKEADADPPSGRPNGCAHKQSGSNHIWIPNGGCNTEDQSDSSLTNESYQDFLNRTKDDGKGMVFTSRSGGQVIYDSDEDSSDSDVVVLDRDPNETRRTIIVDLDSCRSTESRSQFRQHIMQDLKRPFCLEEYTDLLEDWSNQTRAAGHDKNLRNGVTKSYSLPGEFGKSYQETYKDLAGKIDAVAGDRPRKLNLLRGFFYWLKNVAQEGSFKPWNDKACLKVLPDKL